jgi:hypothetical protein
MGFVCMTWGKEGSGKTTFGLTFPKPLYHFDLDVGGFERANWRLPEGTRLLQLNAHDSLQEVRWADYDIVSKPYLSPVQLDKLLGAERITDPVSKKLTVRFPREVSGYRELWQEIIVDYVEVCKQSLVQSVMIDSATQIWNICHNALLQDKQEIQKANGIKPESPLFREKLLPVEFPNDKMRTLIYNARNFGKNLVLTHYPKDDYKDVMGANGKESVKSGTQSPDGFKDTMKLIDVGVWCYTEVNTNRLLADKSANPAYGKTFPFAKIDLKCGLSGLGMQAVGTVLPEPSYDSIIMIQKIAKGEEF